MNESFELIKKIAEDRYYKEHERNERISNSLSIPIGIATALVGIIGFYVSNIPLKMILESTHVVKIVFGLFVVLLLFLCFFLARSIFLLSNVFEKTEYVFIPSPEEWEDYKQKLWKYYEKTKEPDIDQKVKANLQKALVDTYSEAAERNIRLNTLKRFRLTLAKKFIVVSLVFFAISALPFIGLKYFEKSQSDSVQKVKIVGPEEAK